MKIFVAIPRWIYVLVLIFFAVSLAIGLYIGIFEDRDSFAYMVLGEYLFLHRTIPLEPFKEAATTLFGPVYTSVAWPILSLSAPWGMVLLPLVQMLMLSIASVIVGFLTSKVLHKSLGIIAAVTMFFFPFAIIYTTVIMSEVTALFLLSLYIVTLYFCLKKTRWATPAVLLFVSAVLVLTRYAFLPLFLVTLGVFLWDVKKKFHPSQLVGIVGIALILGWMTFNYRLFGSFVISNATGRHLYNNVVTTGHIYPPYPHPKTNFYYTRFFMKSALYALPYPWWDAELLFNDGILTSLFIDHLFMEVSLLSISQHPLLYIQNVFRVFMTAPVTAPFYPEKSLNFLSQCPAQACRVSWHSHLCSPVVIQCSIQNSFARLIKSETSLYPYPMAIVFGIALFGMLYALLRGPLFWRLIAWIFLVQHGFQSATEWIEGRFLIPLYPVYVLLFLFGIKTLLDLPIVLMKRFSHR